MPDYEITDVETLQTVVNAECTDHTVVVKEFNPTVETKTHPATGKEFQRYGATAVVTVDGQEFSINKDEVKFMDAQSAANAVVAEIKHRLCHLMEK
jgi:hypothetical protein